MDLCILPSKSLAMMRTPRGMLHLILASTRRRRWQAVQQVPQCVGLAKAPQPVQPFPGGDRQHRRSQVDRLMTHRIALSEINEGFDRLHRGDAIRQVVEFGE